MAVDIVSTENAEEFASGEHRQMEARASSCSSNLYTALSESIFKNEELFIFESVAILDVLVTSPCFLGLVQIMLSCENKDLGETQIVFEGK
jgi:hypothetical protein